MQVDVLGPHVQEGHYDLIGPNGEIILPSVWEKVVEPDWNITMTMWPMEKLPPVGGPQIPGPLGGRGPQIPPAPGRPGAVSGMPPGTRRSTSGGVPPPPTWHGPGVAPGPHPGVKVVHVSKPSKHHKKSDKAKPTVLMSFLAGKPTKK